MQGICVSHFCTSHCSENEQNASEYQLSDAKIQYNTSYTYMCITFVLCIENVVFYSTLGNIV